MAKDIQYKSFCFLSKGDVHFDPRDTVPGPEKFLSDGEFLIGLDSTIAQLCSAYDSRDEDATFHLFFSIDRSPHYGSPSAFPIIHPLLELCLRIAANPDQSSNHVCDASFRALLFVCETSSASTAFLYSHSFLSTFLENFANYPEQSRDFGQTAFACVLIDATVDIVAAEFSCVPKLMANFDGATRAIAFTLQVFCSRQPGCLSGDSLREFVSFLGHRLSALCDARRSACAADATYRLLWSSLALWDVHRDMALYRLFYKEVRMVFSAWNSTPMIPACCLDVWRMVCASLKPERARSFLLLLQAQGLFQQILLYREPPCELFDFFGALAAKGPGLIDYLFDSGFVEQMLRRYDSFSYTIRKVCSEILVAIFENGNDRQLGRFFGVGVNFFTMFVDLCEADDVQYQDTILGGLHTIFTRMRLSNRLSCVKQMFAAANGIDVFGSMDEGAEKALALLREFELDAPPDEEETPEFHQPN